MLRCGSLWDAFTCTLVRFLRFAVKAQAADTRYCCITALFSPKSASETSTAVQEAVWAIKHCLSFPRATAVYRTSPTGLLRAALSRRNMAILKVYHSDSCFPTARLSSVCQVVYSWLKTRYGSVRSSITVQSLVTWPVPPELWFNAAK